MCMWFILYFIVYSGCFNFIDFYVSDEPCTFNFLFLFTFMMYLECHCFIYVGVNIITRKYGDIAWRSWEYVHTWIDFLKMLMEKIQSCK